MRNKFVRKRFIVLIIMSLVLLALLVFLGRILLTPEQEPFVEDYVYLEESTDMGRSQFLRNIVFQDGRLYYLIGLGDGESEEVTYYLEYRELSNSEVTEILMLEAPQTEIYQGEMHTFFFDPVGDLYAVWNMKPVLRGEEGTTYLAKYDGDGDLVHSQDIGAALAEVGNQYISGAAVDGDGRIYMIIDDEVFLFDGEGNFQNIISPDADLISGIFATREGRVFLTYLEGNAPKMMELGTGKIAGEGAGREETGGGEAVGESGAMDMREIVYNLPSDSGIVSAGSEGKVLVAGAENLYEYDLETGEAVTLLNWVECNVRGGRVQKLYLLEEGDISVYCDNQNRSRELVTLRKTPASEIPEKEILTLATLYGADAELQESIVDFNRTNDYFRVEVKSYVDANAQWTENTYLDALLKLNAELVSDNAPDLINLSGLEWENLMENGALEDLTPYLEQSSAANKADFVTTLLAAYRVDGKQATVPRSFRLRTLMGKRSIVWKYTEAEQRWMKEEEIFGRRITELKRGAAAGEDVGWTVGDMLSLTAEYPEATLLTQTNAVSALNLCMRQGGADFIDYETGTCHFDSPEFIEVLELARQFQESSDQEVNLPKALSGGEILLHDVTIASVSELQMYQQMFGEETVCIGFPTADGSVGVSLLGYETYGICAKSDAKEGAWEFLESTLRQGEMEEHYWNFPSRLDELEIILEEEMKNQYLYDENGKFVHDKQGHPIRLPKTTWQYGDEWETEIYGATQKDIDTLWMLIGQAKPESAADQMVFNIIREESQAYFQGQKSAEEVAGIIQNRVGIYVSENYGE